MKITKQQLRRIIQEEMNNLLIEASNQKQEFIDITRNNILKNIKVSILTLLDMFELNKKDPNFKFSDEFMIKSAIDKLKLQINNSHPEIISNITSDINNVIEELKKQIESSSPETIKDFQKISDEYMKLASEYRY
jgi:hypothetical protein